MKVEEFNNLSKEEQQKEVERCKSFEYFYNNYCKREDMPEFSQEVWEDYLKQNEKQRFSRRRNTNSSFYPLTPQETFKK